MFRNIGRSVVLIGSAAGVTLCLAGGVAVGVVPQAGAPPTPQGQPAQPVAAAAAPPAPVAPAVTAPPAPAPPVTAPPTTSGRATAPRRTVSTEAPASDAAAPAAAAPAGPYVAPRLNPSSAALQSAMSSMKVRNPVYGSLTEAQAREFGNQVCSAFDAGQTSAQVQAAALQQAAKIPFATVSAADVRFAVSSAVGLFCPGYLSRV